MSADGKPTGDENDARHQEAIGRGVEMIAKAGRYFASIGEPRLSIRALAFIDEAREMQARAALPVAASDPGATAGAQSVATRLPADQLADACARVDALPADMPTTDENRKLAGVAIEELRDAVKWLPKKTIEHGPMETSLERALGECRDMKKHDGVQRALEKVRGVVLVLKAGAM